MACNMKTAFLFSGQGAQYPGMMKELYDTEAAAREVFQCADDVLGRAISELCFYAAQEELNLTHNTQPCMLAADLAVAAVLKRRGVAPAALAGFSLGEYAALVQAGVFSLEDAFEIVQLRADAMQKAVPVGKGAMAALACNAEQAEILCASIKQGYVAPANYNSHKQTVIAGEKETVEALMKEAVRQGIKALMLPVSAPFHCKMMEPAARRLKEVLARKQCGKPGLPVYMNVTGKVLQGSEDVPAMLAEQVMRPVRWIDTLQNMRADGVGIFIECGPGKTLSGLVKKTLRDVQAFHVENIATLDVVLRALEQNADCGREE